VTTIRKLEAAADAVLVKPNRRERASLREIGRIRKRAGKIVQKKGGAISKRVKRLSTRLRRRMSSSKSRDDGSGAEEALASVVHLLRDPKRPPTLGPQNLHPYRLKVKKLRDVIRLAQGPVQAGLVAALGEAKDAVGDWHDWEELLSIAAKVLDGQSGSLLDRAAREATPRNLKDCRITAFVLHPSVIGPIPSQRRGAFATHKRYPSAREQAIGRKL
jgi:hypothetical protein